jgi:hypothetical protein
MPVAKQRKRAQPYQRGNAGLVQRSGQRPWVRIPHLQSKPSTLTQVQRTVKTYYHVLVHRLARVGKGIRCAPRAPGILHIQKMGN